jgi:hypothetical protein
VFFVVPVEALVKGLDSQEIRGWPGSGDGTFGLPSKGWRVIGSRCNGAFADVESMSDNILVNDSGQQLQVTVCYCAIWVVEAH